MGTRPPGAARSEDCVMISTTAGASSLRPRHCRRCAEHRGVLGFIASRGRRRRRDHCQEICAGCGYDLRATPIRCPECGKASAVRP